MKIWKLVAGILSIVLTVVVLIQSLAAGMVNAIEDNGGSSGTVGFLVAVLLLAGGITSICVRKSQGKGGNIAIIVIFGLAALLGFTAHGNYKDLVVWAFWCLINVVLAIVCLIKAKKNDE